MAFLAVIGCGALGGAVAHTLAVRDRIAEIRLIDPAGAIATGKALDLQQSGPVDLFRARLTSADRLEAAAGAAAVIVADSADGSVEYAGDAGLTMIRQLVRSGMTSPIVFAGTSQRELAERTVTELHVPRGRVIGSAPGALESALRAMVALALDGSAAEVELRVVGVPPRSAVVAWNAAVASGQPIAAQLPAHVIAGLSARIPGLWPPGPYALASAAARVAEAIANGSRRRFSCFVVSESGPARAAVVALPVELGSGGIRRVLEPTLSRQERTLLENAVER